MWCSPQNNTWCQYKGLFIAALLVFLPGAAFAESELVYVGSGRQNIDGFRLDLASGALSSIGQVADIKAPSFIAISPNLDNLYAVTEGSSEAGSTVSAFGMNVGTGQLVLLNSQPSGGSGPCYVSVDPKSTDVLVANYGSGSVSAFPISTLGALAPMTGFFQDHGSSINPDRQEGPHAHCIVTDPDGRFAFACDLGLDKVMIFKLDRSNGTLVTNDPPFASVKPGSGPRHIVFAPDSGHAYVINEMASTLTAFSYDRQRGALTQVAEYPLLPSDFKGQNYAAEVAIHPSGKFIYASNRGNDSIAVFACDEKTGQLTFIERDSTQGQWPRDFEIDPTGTFLLVANERSNSVVVFRIDTKTGRLQSTGNKVTTDKPQCVKCVRVANP